MIDTAVGGALMNKTTETTYELLENLPSNNYQWSIERFRMKSTTGVLELIQITS